MAGGEQRGGKGGRLRDEQQDRRALRGEPGLQRCAGQPSEDLEGADGARGEGGLGQRVADADAWHNSILLRGEAVDTVAELKARPGNDLSINGSVSLVRSLHAAGLIDDYTLLIHPLALGSGTRLFDGPLG